MNVNEDFDTYVLSWWTSDWNLWNIFVKISLLTVFIKSTIIQRDIREENALQNWLKCFWSDIKQKFPWIIDFINLDCSVSRFQWILLKSFRSAPASCSMSIVDRKVSFFLTFSMFFIIELYKANKWAPVNKGNKVGRVDQRGEVERKFLRFVWNINDLCVFNLEKQSKIHK